MTGKLSTQSWQILKAVFQEICSYLKKLVFSVIEVAKFVSKNRCQEMNRQQHPSLWQADYPRPFHSQKHCPERHRL
ncbi:MAG: hypothetical protein ACXWAS_18520, partial [Methylobacter sp.]